MDKEPPFRFAVLSYLPQLEHLMEPLIDDTVFSLDFFKTSFNTSMLGVPDLLDKKYEVILCYSAIGITIMRELGRSIVLIQKTDYDVILALQKAKSISDNVSISIYKEERTDIEHIEQLLSMKIEKIHFNTIEEFRERLPFIRDVGAEVIVGGGISLATAHQYGLIPIPVVPNRQSLQLAVEQAIHIARIQRREKKYQEQLLNMLRAFQVGVLCVTKEYKIIYSNDKAWKFLGIQKKQTNTTEIRKLLDSISVAAIFTSGIDKYENIVTINGRQLIISTMMLSIQQDQDDSVVVFIQDVAEHHSIDGLIHEVQKRSGFTARYNIEDICTKSPVMQSLKKKVQLYAPHDAPVWIMGESGTGKELVAQSLHSSSPRRNAPFVAINCAALPESLLESELFGYEDGAFTGARRGGKPGLFEVANHGTLLLDEVGDMRLSTQALLLRILEAGELVRVGGNRLIPVNVRTVCASNQFLPDLVAQKVFRKDLFYRLAMLRLHIPPLKERLQDIPLLIEPVLRRYGKSMQHISPAMMRALKNYTWPGNIRELKAVMESYLILLGGRDNDPDLFMDLFENWIHNAPLPESSASSAEDSLTGNMGQPLKSQLEYYRKQIARNAVSVYGNNRQKAALQLGISYNTLWRILNDS